MYNSLVYASTHDGLRQALATDRVAFSHSDVDAFRDTLRDILATRPLLRQGKRSVLIAVEAVYSIDGDMCPLQELVEAGKDFFQDHKGSIQLVVDEAHSIRFTDPKGRGLICELELEKELTMVIHSFGKAISAAGGLCLSVLSCGRL